MYYCNQDELLRLLLVIVVAEIKQYRQNKIHRPW